MVKVNEHEPGMFSWADLSTTDPAAAKTFYQALFGWAYDDNAAGPDENYSAARIDGESAAALYSQGDEETQNGIPAHWNCYFTVKDVDAQSKKIRRAGGQLFCPPFDVFDSGRMCIFAEPAQAVAALWQPKRQIGATLMGEHGTLAWAELWSRDIATSRQFLVQLFGFQTELMRMPSGDCTVFKVGDTPSCGMRAMPVHMPDELPSLWVPYFGVKDCDVAVNTAKANAGKLLSPMSDAPNVGRFATLSDPQGAIFAVVESQAPLNDAPQGAHTSKPNGRRT